MNRLLSAALLATVIGLAEPSARADEFAGKTVTGRPMAMKMIASRVGNAPKAGEKAPDFTLEPASGGKPVALSSYWKERPLALFFGSLSCDVSSFAADEIRRLHQTFGDEVQFLYVYIREAHPANGWEYEKGAEVVDPVTILERQHAASEMCRKREFPFPALVDRLTDDAAIAYAAWPARCLLIDTSGIVRYAGYTGPWGFKPTDAMPLVEVLRPDILYFAPKQDEVVSLESFLKSFLRKSKDGGSE